MGAPAWGVLAGLPASASPVKRTAVDVLDADEVLVVDEDEVDEFQRKVDEEDDLVVLAKSECSVVWLLKRKPVVARQRPYIRGGNLSFHLDKRGMGENQLLVALNPLCGEWKPEGLRKGADVRGLAS